MTVPAEEAAYLDALKALWRKNWPKDAPRAPVYPLGEIPLTEILRRRASLTPAKASLIYYGREVSFGELDRLSDAFASWLHAHGVGKGDRVAVFLPNCPQFHVAFFGILKLGAVHVPVNPLFKAQELIYELNDTGAKVVVALDALFPLLAEVKGETAVEIVLVTSAGAMLPETPTIPLPAGLDAAPRLCPGAIDLLPALAAVTEPPPAVAVGLDDIAALNYTGGTTGLPKGCVHTQRDMIYTAATTCAVGIDLKPEDVGLNFLPVFWIAGEDMGVIFPIFSGATYVLLARWDPIAFVAAVERYRVTVATLLVDNAVEVTDHPRAGAFDLRSLEQVRCSSFVMKLSLTYRQRWRELTGTILIEAAWGMTETHTCDTFATGLQDDDLDLKAQPIFVGLPVPGTEFKICDFATGALMPLGAEGELCVRSPSNLKGYWSRPQASAEALSNGWLHTGDLGLIDASGFIHFLGRRKEMLKVRGMSVFPAEIEAMLGQHPAIVGSGVIGREDAERGQVPVAFVLVKDAAQGKVTEAELSAWCRDAMASYKTPEIRIVPALPMTATGKVKKEELAKLL